MGKGYSFLRSSYIVFSAAATRTWLMGSSGLSQPVYGLRHNEELYDPLVNAKAALAISNGGRNWKPWGAHQNGAFRKYLAEFDSL